MQKVCSTHGETKHFPRPDGAFRCGKCASAWVIKNRRNKKEKIGSAVWRQMFSVWL